ncbi:Hypothetical predicted protein [Olea europaea subsp. europaea]|uniref:Uncharacterized protein n=1 Tax=Olea europaea subsp. europaea TaxID=158383 RepID=A0A8S0Q273_OLEEU|nr:Hypothetical predicted protein [Olea europaea subsp. europaea]
MDGLDGNGGVEDLGMEEVPLMVTKEEDVPMSKEMVEEEEILVPKGVAEVPMLEDEGRGDGEDPRFNK